MTNPSQPMTADEAEQLLGQLRRKEGSWVAWGKACQRLQRSGYQPQTIFEATGFEPVQQNQIIVGMQVYEGIAKVGTSPDVLEHFSSRASDILYELRVLNQQERALAAEVAFTKTLDTDEVHELVRAVKSMAQLRRLPEGFTTHPGDAVAYQAWRLAQQSGDLQERSRLIAKALKFAHTDSARTQVEGLLTDFSVKPKRSAPTLSVYRLDAESELPRVIPVVGHFPITRTDLQAVPFLETTGSFRLLTYAGQAAWIALPGWSIVLDAEDPVVLFMTSQQLDAVRQDSVSLLPPDHVETVAVLIDRAQRTWQADSYFLTEDTDHIQIQWFEDEPSVALLARVLMVVRPPRILDESLNRDPWQVDE